MAIHNINRATHVVFTNKLRVELLDRDIPGPGPTELQIRSVRTLISTGTELTVLLGNHTPGSVWNELFAYPWDAGYCNVGIVEQVGEEVTQFKSGDKIASTGPHATRFNIAEKDCVLIPESVDDDEAVFSTIAQIVMQGVRQSHIILGENVTVCGLGLLGQMTVLLSRHVGAWPIVAIDLEKIRRDCAIISGATVSGGSENAKQIVFDHSEGRMSDVVFEVTGSPDVIPEALMWARPLGRFVMISSPSGPTTIDFHDLVNARGTTIIGAHNYTHASVANEYNRWTRNTDTAYYLSLVESERVKAKHLISHRFSWKRAIEAYQQLVHQRSTTLGVVLEWTD